MAQEREKAWLRDRAAGRPADAEREEQTAATSTKADIDEPPTVPPVGQRPTRSGFTEGRAEAPSTPAQGHGARPQHGSEPAPRPTFCEQCGAALGPESKFCAHCGASVASDQWPAAEAPAEPLAADASPQSSFGINWPALVSGRVWGSSGCISLAVGLFLAVVLAGVGLEGEGTATIVAIIMGLVFVLVLLAQFTDRSQVLYCPFCRKRVKMGADLCHHCGRNVHIT